MAGAPGRQLNRAGEGGQSLGIAVSRDVADENCQAPLSLPVTGGRLQQGRLPCSGGRQQIHNKDSAAREFCAFFRRSQASVGKNVAFHRNRLTNHTGGSGSFAHRMVTVCSRTSSPPAISRSAVPQFGQTIRTGWTSTIPQRRQRAVNGTS